MNKERAAEKVMVHVYRPLTVKDGAVDLFGLAGPPPRLHVYDSLELGIILAACRVTFKIPVCIEQLSIHSDWIFGIGPLAQYLLGVYLAGKPTPANLGGGLIHVPPSIFSRFLVSSFSHSPYH